MIAIAFGDITWILLAFLLGFIANLVGLPALVGFLVAGFSLGFLGADSGETLQQMADLGITLLLFTVGLKLELKSLLRAQVWGTTLLHMSVITLAFGFLIVLLGVVGLSIFSELTLAQSILLAFALSFSSTVFVVKVLESRGEVTSQHGRTAIGILIVQDLIAVLFIVLSSGKWPSIWALLLLLLIPLRFVLIFLLRKAGHGEVLILFGLALALGGAQVFELVGVKGDLGALISGVLISGHYKAKELADSLLGFKDIFLVGFFLSIGINSELELQLVLVGLVLVPLIILKLILFLKLLMVFRLRARTAVFASINLSNYSEFGLIVASIVVANQWLDAQWLVVLVVALSASLLLGAPLAKYSNSIFRRYRGELRSWQSSVRLPEDRPIDTHGASIAIFGMGRVGTGAYDEMEKSYPSSVIGIDHDTRLVEGHVEQQRFAITGNPADPDFWEKVESNEPFDLVLLALPNVGATMAAVNLLRELNYPAEIAAVVSYADDARVLTEHGVQAVYNIYSAAGSGFAEHVLNRNPSAAEN